MPDKIGFIGLGVMGAPMARHISEHYEAIVFDTNPARIPLVSRASAAKSVAEVGGRANSVLLSLPSSEIVKEVVLGPGGLATSMSRGSTIIDVSTTAPNVSQEVAAALNARGIGFLDAPVSGGEKAAIEGTLSIMVGGDEDAFARSLPLLRTMGTSVVRVGGSGMGGVAKLVNNLIVGITFAAVAEGFALGTKCGLGPKVLYEAIRGGWAGSRVLEVSVPAMLARDFRPGGTVNIHWKDLGYALALARENDVPVPVTALTHEVFKAARASGRGQLSQPAIINLWEELLKIEIKE